MPPDQLFDDDKKPDETPAQTPAQNGGVTMDQVQQAMKVYFDGLNEQLTQFGQQVVAAIQQVQAPQTPEPTNTDVATDLLEDPGSVIDQRVDGRIRERLGPYLQTQIGDKLEDLLIRHRVSVDERYGDGTFEKIYRPELDRQLDTLPPETKSSAAHIQSLIEGITGRKTEELRPLANELEKKRAEALDPPPMLPGGLPIRTQLGHVDQADRAFGEVYEKATGRTLDLKKLATVRDQVTNEDRPFVLSDFVTPKEDGR
jgi:hypothetical protein